jgi:glycosyltransferase involved in cell wall biosynthesis
MSFSVLILTHNEADNLEACLASLRGCDDVVVLDSGSTDATVEIAKAAGVRVFYRAFDSFAAQRNYALQEITFAHQWVFQLDADERMTEELLDECNVVSLHGEYSAYFVANRLYFLGRWIKRASQYPYYQVRFLKIGEADFSGGGHGQYAGRSDKGFGYMKQSYIHYNFSKGIKEWVAKHNRYSSIEADIAAESRTAISWRFKTVFDAYERKKFQKQIYYRLPFRPWLKYFYLLFVAGGIMDGRPGRVYCRLVFLYEYLIWVKGLELRYRKAGGPL